MLFHTYSNSTTYHVTVNDADSDGITYTAWAAVPSGTFSARYVRLRWTVSGDAPVLYRAHFRLYV